MVTIYDSDDDKVGALTLAGRYAKSSLELGLDGYLTTTGKGRAAAHTDSAAATMHDDFLFARQAPADSTDADLDRGTDNATLPVELTESAVGAPMTGPGHSIQVLDPQHVFDFAGLSACETV